MPKPLKLDIVRIKDPRGPRGSTWSSSLGPLQDTRLTQRPCVNCSLPNEIGKITPLRAVDRSSKA